MVSSSSSPITNQTFNPLVPEQVIAFETIKRLMSEGKLSKLQIDNTGIFSMGTDSVLALVTKRCVIP